MVVWSTHFYGLMDETESVYEQRNEYCNAES